MNGWVKERVISSSWDREAEPLRGWMSLLNTLIPRSPGVPVIDLSLQGRDCEVSLDSCSSSPCGNGGTCHAQEGQDGGFM